MVGAWALFTTHSTVRTTLMNKKTCLPGLNPRPGRPFSITRPGRGGGRCDPPWRFETKRRSASRKKTIDCSRRVLAIGGTFFDPRSTFDLVMAGQRSIFGEIDVFQLYKTIATEL